VARTCREKVYSVKKIDSPKYGRYAKRRFGQNFLQDANIIRKILEALEIEPDDKVIEIGPGHGALSKKIAEYSPALYAAVEFDIDLALELRDKCPSIQPLAADALTIQWEKLRADSGNWKLIGNLPYNVASPLMWEILSRATAVSHAVFMIQKEVGQRIIAEPGSRTYGALSVWLQSFAQPEYLFTVSPNVFVPRPKVHSAVLRFTPQNEKIDFEPAALSGLLKKCFQNRRKQLGKILKSCWNQHIPLWLENEGLDSRVRPEDLTPKQFQALSGLIKTDFMA